MGGWYAGGWYAVEVGMWYGWHAVWWAWHVEACMYYGGVPEVSPAMETWPWFWPPLAISSALGSGTLYVLLPLEGLGAATHAETAPHVPQTCGF